MAIETCERCGEQSAKLFHCFTCNKRIDNPCIKSSRRKGEKIGIAYICRTCWSDIPKRKKFKALGAYRNTEERRWERY